MSNAAILRCACGYEAPRDRMAEHQANLRWWWLQHAPGIMGGTAFVRIQEGDYWDYSNGPLHSLLADEP